MPRKNCVDDLRHHGIVVPDNAREHRSVAIDTQPACQVLAQFVLNAARAQTLFGKDTTAQFTQCARKTTHERNPHKQTFPDYTRRSDGAFQTPQPGLNRTPKTEHPRPNTQDPYAHRAWPLPQAFSRAFDARRRFGTMLSR